MDFSGRQAVRQHVYKTAQYSPQDEKENNPTDKHEIYCGFFWPNRQEGLYTKVLAGYIQMGTGCIIIPV
ncbi:hypothetical protein IBK_1193 [Dehalococcoides mccartyi IBARAKI]|nr:hypothetical protein IBK_1193 [Dehalococcoides mccartyi IBARAKI]